MQTRLASWALALTATLTMAVSYLDRQTFAVLAPTVTKALDISEIQYGWLASAFSIAYLAGAPLAGRFIDIVGARRGLLGAVLVWSTVAGLHALVPGFGVLFFLRIALGLAESPTFPGAAQTVHRALPPADRARGFGILFTGSSFGAMVAPPLATALEARWDWRIAFVGTAVVSLIWVPFWLAFAWSRSGRAVLDAPGETTHTTWAEWLALWRHPAVLRAVVAVLATSPALAFAFLWGAKFLVRTYGVTQKQVGELLWIPPVLFDIGAILFGHLASQRAARPDHDGSPPRFLFAVAAFLALLIAVMPHAPGPLASMVVAGVAIAGGGAVFALLTAEMLARVPSAQVSSAGGITAAAQSIGYIIASPLIGASVEAHQSYRPILWQLALWIVPGCLLWLFWRDQRR